MPITSRRTFLLGLTGLVTTALAGTGVAWLIRYAEKAQIRPLFTPTPSAGMLLLTYYGHFGYVYTVAWSPDGTKIASGSDDHSVHVWDARSGADIIPTYSGHLDGVIPGMHMG